VCVGGATVDRIYRAQDALRPGTPNPVTLRRTFGGVARNVAESLARLGAKVALISAAEDDDNGRAMTAHLAELGVKVSHVQVMPGRATAEYVAVIEPSGELAFGLADMAVFEALTPDTLASARGAIEAGTLVFADCNLSADTLASLLARRGAVILPMLAVDAVSAPKVVRLPADLTGVDLLFFNEDEALALLGRALLAEDAAADLRARGAASVVLTRGARSVLVGNENGVTPLPAVPVAAVSDVTGAGDALVAAALQRLAGGDDLLSAVRAGLVAAAVSKLKRSRTIASASVGSCRAMRALKRNPSRVVAATSRTGQSALSSSASRSDTRSSASS
jgi:pseudouridine kinase